MRTLQPFQLLVGLAALIVSSGAITAADSATRGGKVRVLLVYGGHDFETNQFFQVFRDNPKITLRTAEYPKAQEWFRPEQAGEYDVLVFYDMWQDISERSKQDLMALLKGGKSLVALHHTLAAFQKWDEYASIIGGRYHQSKWNDHGVEKPASTFEHDVHFNVQIADRNHPVTRGLADFPILDEVYGGFEVRPESHVLLTTDSPKNGRNIAWWNTYGKGHVIYIQLGHDHQAYENPNYRKLLAQAIDWAARGGQQTR